MKYIATIVLFFFCGLASAQQESNVFSISPEHPTIGSAFTVTYNAAAPTAKLKDATGIELYSLVFRNGDDPLFLDLPMKKEGNRWTASGQIADKNSSYMIFRCVSTEQADDNGDNGFDAMIAGSDGKPVLGSHEARGLILSYGQYNSFKRTKDLERAKDELNQEMQMYPQNWRAQIDLLSMKYREDHSDEGKARLKPEVEKTFETNKENEEAVARIVESYGMYGDSAKADMIEKEAIASKPHGIVARLSRWSKITSEQDGGKRVSEILQYLKDYPDLEKKEMRNKLVGLYSAYHAAKENDKAAEVLSRLDNSAWGTWNELAWDLIDKGEDLENAVAWARKGVDLSRTPDPDAKRFYSTLKEWERGQKYGTGSVLDTYAYGLFQLGKTEDAEKSYAEAYQLMNGDAAEVNGRYMECLIKNGRYDKAYEVGFDRVKNGKSDEKLIDELKIAFAEKEGSTDAFAKLTEEKQKKFENLLADAGKSNREAAKKKALESRISKPSVDFTLNDLSGKPVTLSALKGKIVIVDFWATWCGPCKASFPYLQKVHEKYRSNEKVVFLAVDTWEHEKDVPATIENAKKFMAEHKYTFPVVFDVLTGKKVAEKYEVDGIPTKFIIDKKGNIAFKSIGFMGPDMEDELISQIELLLGERS